MKHMVMSITLWYVYVYSHFLLDCAPWTCPCAYRNNKPACLRALHRAFPDVYIASAAAEAESKEPKFQTDRVK